MNSEIQPADTALRTKVLATMGVVCLLAVAGVLLLDAYFERLQILAQHDIQLAALKLRAVAEPLVMAVGAGAVLAGLWAMVGAVRILRSGRFPPPGMKVIHQTRIVTGRPATLRGVVGLVLGLTLIFLGLRLPLQASRILDTQLNTKPQPIPIQASTTPSAQPGTSLATEGDTAECSEDGA